MSMEIIDAKQAFLGWNKKNFEYFVSLFEPEQQSALTLLPLLLQTNNRLLPGYNGANTPAGVYGYLPDASVINEARKSHEKFRFDQLRPLKNTIIESVFLQRDILTESLTLWVVHIDKLKSDQFDILENKIARIQAWLKSRNLNVNSKLLTAKRLSKKSKPAAIFLDDFYHQSFLLAGKYPVWWLVPPEKEEGYEDFVKHIKTARFVNAEEFLDLGGLSGLVADDILKLAIKHAQDVYKAPDISFLRLLLLKQKQDVWPKIEGLAYQLKRDVYSGNKNTEQFFSHNIVFEALQASIEERLHKQSLNGDLSVSYSKLFALLSYYTKTASTSFLMSLSEDIDMRPRDVGVSEYLNFNKILFSEIQAVYIDFINQYNRQTQHKSESTKLISLAKNIQSFLSQDKSRVPVYITQDKTEFILDRALLKHNVETGKLDTWSIIMELDEGEEKIIAVFDDLITLIVWAWLNRIVDRSTQISIKCPKLLVKQTEAHYVLEVLIQNITPDVICNTPVRVFERPNKPLRSFLFFNLVAFEFQKKQIEAITREDDPLNFGDEAENLFASCEQLVINSWGDLHAQRYSGNDGVLQCLCDWTHHAPLSRTQVPQELKCFGYGSGESTFMAQRIDQVYEELIQFFYHQKNVDGCFIVRMGNDYYAVIAEQDNLQQNRIGHRQALYPYLEQTNTAFRSYALERLALPDSPLREILQRNKKDVIQVFFQTVNRACETWVLDEKGSLCHIRQDWFDRSGYVAHWLYVMRNIRNRLKKINYQDRELPALELFEVSRNRLGVMGFHPVGSEDVNKNRGFVDIQVEVEGDELGERISLICDGKRFGFDEYGDRVVTETVQYISAKLAGEGPLSVYVTDIKAPLRLYGVEDRDNIQVVHFLKYIRNIETMLNKLLYG